LHCDGVFGFLALGGGGLAWVGVEVGEKEALGWRGIALEWFSLVLGYFIRNALYATLRIII